MKIYVQKVLSLFFILSVVFIPLTFYGKDIQFLVTNFIFRKPVLYFQNCFFSIAIQNIDFSSDTISLNILIGLLLVISALAIIIFEIFKVQAQKLITTSRLITAYYIAFILLKYGLDKIFKKQFYLPEPNILYTQFGDLSKDILYWSTIGTSHLYSLITGIVEVLTALLIVNRKTRALGLILSIGIIFNIILINFSFDISVKTFSIFLLLAIIFSSYPYYKSIYQFFVLQNKAQLVEETDLMNFTNPTKKILKGLFILGSLALVLYPFIAERNFNDDHAQRPLLHGAYEIKEFSINDSLTNKTYFPFKRLFFHRNSYIILQQEDGKMLDYFCEEKANQQLELQDYSGNKTVVTYFLKNGELVLKFANKQQWHIKAKPLEWKKLPALQDKIHITIDEIK